jgi:hypothetical protein
MPEVQFIETSNSIKPGFSIGVTLNRPSTKGEVGIEIEVEGNKFPKPEGHEGTYKAVSMPGMKYWSYVHDGSLRGKDNAEYVLTKPIMFSQADEALGQLWAKLNAHGSVIDDSNRTSVHVHLNCQEFHINRLTAFMAMWYALEEPLTEFCGEHRVGNLFCLRAVDAPATISYLRRFIKTSGEAQLPECLHYGGLNPQALMKYGSIEIRTLRGCNDPKTILDWVKILERLYTFSAEFPDPREVVALFSSGGPLSYFDTLLGDKAELVRQAINWSNEDISAAMFRGIRFAQELCYARDWDEFKALEIKPDPFGRDSRKLAQKIANMTVDVVAAAAVQPVMQPEYDDPDDYPEPDDYPGLDDSPISQPAQPSHYSLNSLAAALGQGAIGAPGQGVYISNLGHMSVDFETSPSNPFGE